MNQVVNQPVIIPLGYLIAGAVVWIAKSIIFDWLKNRNGRSNGNGGYVDNRIYTELKLMAGSNKRQEEKLDSLNNNSIKEIALLEQIKEGFNKL